MRQLGAAGTPMAYSEVLPAIQRRVLDGASSAITVMGPSKFYTAAKYITPTHITYIPTAMWTNAKFLAKLSEKERGILDQVGSSCRLWPINGPKRILNPGKRNGAKKAVRSFV